MQVMIVAVYLAVVLLIGVWAGRGVKTLEDYATAGKTFGMMAIFATLSASFIGGGFSMGNAEKVFLVGVSNIVALWGFSLKEILVARFIVPQMVRYPDAISVGDIMDAHYGRGARIFSGVFGVVLCAGILGAQVGAMGHVFHLFLGIERIWGVLLGCSIVILYSTVGGMRAVVWTDILQFTVLAVGIPLALYYGVESVGGWQSMVQAVPAQRLSLPSDPMGMLGLGSLFLAFVLGETLVPPYVQRLAIGRSVKDVSRGTLLSGVFSIPFFAMTGLIGLVALAMNPNVDANLAMPYVIENAMPPVLQGIVVAAIISIIMSSADSYLNAAGIAFSNDIVRPLLRAPQSPTATLRMAQVITFLVGAMAVVFAVAIESVLDILLYAYNFWAPTVLVPLAAAILGFSVSRRRFVVGAVAGISAALLWSAALGNPWGIDGLVVGAVANGVAFFSVDRANARKLLEACAAES
ncbi:MAG: sodium:solute symporter family protein [Rhodospirillaceae bacterium]|nr:sodium:solute symporter family protein [Rhodospirillaceae bacterium]